MKRNSVALYRHDIKRLSKCTIHNNFLHQESECVINFLLKCIAAIIRKDPLMHEHICSADKQTAKKLMYPFKNEYIHLANFKYHPKIIREIKSQKGTGIILSSLIAAAIPLITSLIESIVKKNELNNI